ncbi:hypothetical protein OOT33_01230 [Sphingobium sp. DEHP117]|uniref:tetratricopeptide repeat protein n=1 Tax=Sphingobium sp. DEHP117 TaxID=2993436 RepID=UPI0027D51A80|nr:hypothetical protein [Sphingobium sp. DEHP117]MDQ4419071.1 hypothetical protein [Sphingobium sp. DEHP117]
MRKVSPVALGLMLALGGVSLGVSAPAVYAKAKAPTAPQAKPSAGFLGPVQKLQEAVNKKDIAAAQAALPAAQAAAKTPDDAYFLNSMKLNLSILANDAVMQGEALKGMLDSGFVPPEQQGQFSAILASRAYDAKDYDTALSYGEKAAALNYKPEEVNVVLAQAIWAKGKGNPSEIARGLDYFRKAIDARKAAGQPVDPSWYQMGVQQASRANLPQIKDWATMAYDARPTGDALRTLLRIYQRENPAMTSRENLDLLRLMQYSGGLGVKGDFLEYAEMAFKGGIYGEVKSVIDAGRSARDARSNFYLTSVDGNDTYTIASQKIAADKATLAGAAADAAKAATGKVAAATADAYMGYGDNAKAISLYEMALQKGGAGVDVAEVNTRLGIAQARAGNTEAAKASFAKVTGGARGAIAQYWLKWLNRTPAA